jgi:hypothetical protein
MPVEQPQVPLIVPVNTWDNHKLHIEGHNEYRKSQAFENLPEETKTLFESHVQQHIAAMGVEMMTQNPSIQGGIPPEVAMMGMPQPGGSDGGNAANAAVKQGDQPQGPPQGQGQPGPMPMPEMGGPQ